MMAYAEECTDEWVSLEFERWRAERDRQMVQPCGLLHSSRDCCNLCHPSPGLRRD